jgi:hypothetical protein
MHDSDSDAAGNGNGDGSTFWAPTPHITDRKQTGCCYEAQADGVPCQCPDTACEFCLRSMLFSELDRPDTES